MNKSSIKADMEFDWQIELYNHELVGQDYYGIRECYAALRRCELANVSIANLKTNSIKIKPNELFKTYQRVHSDVIGGSCGYWMHWGHHDELYGKCIYCKF